MSVDEAIEHGLAWIAAGWEWAGGQTAINTNPPELMVNGSYNVYPVTGQRDDGRYLVIAADTMMLRVINATVADSRDGWESEQGFVPDMRDEGTRGHALAQVRRALGDNMAAASWSHATGKWMVWSPLRPGRLGGCGDTETEALLAARQAAS